VQEIVNLKHKTMNTMKKLLMLFSAVIGSVWSTPAFAQNKASSGSGGKCYDESTHLINLGVGLTGSYYAFDNRRGYSHGRTPAFIFVYEQPLKNKVGPGYIGIGPYLSYQNAHERYDGDWYVNGNERYYYEHNWNYFVIAARGAYHWDVLNSSKGELYAGTIIGVRVDQYTYRANYNDPNYDYRRNDGSVYPAVAVYAGARWYFVPNVALYGEVASGVSFLTGGFTFKF
jgi:hypothetical protein